MDAIRWQSAREAFGVAISHEPEEWPRLLDDLCAEDAELHEEVASLLAAHRDAGSFLEVDVGDAVGASEDEEAEDPLIGRNLGAYRLVQRLGGGGMGVVYLAVRADSELHERVAVKVLKPGMESEESVRRFRTERQILAALDHPHIARLLDGGTTHWGLPYFVMEYVAGEPITDYCERRGLLIAERLALFQTVCAAVQFAHRNLIIHRDLKPANILVTTDGTPRLLDFGIAKRLDAELSQSTELPGCLEWRPMTPGYASPEQVLGGYVTTASDVYSLGVLLYELLTCRSPYPGGLTDPWERALWICDHEPHRPSEAVADRPGGVLLGALLAGDLDAVALKALAREPSRRYASPERLSEDLGRFLKGLPIQARRGAATCRAVDARPAQKIPCPDPRAQVVCLGLPPG